MLSLSAGGVSEPRADWSEAALQHVHSALRAKAAVLGLKVRMLADDEAVVARSIAIHHMWGGNNALPTKEGKLDWSLGDAVLPIHAATGGDYALFIWIYRGASSISKLCVVALVYQAPRLTFFPRHKERVEAIAKSAVIKTSP